MPFWPLQLKQIDPPLLKELLDRARIKWRIVVVSPCYSGGFIESLKDDRTFIATAAADRQSFGCGHENDFTYFGQAYFDEALRRTYSFSEAFQGAAVAIARREEAERKLSSRPQIAVGPAIRPNLEEFARRLSQGSKGRTVPQSLAMPRTSPAASLDARDSSTGYSGQVAQT